MARTRSIERHAPDGETHVVERDEYGKITGVSNALHYTDWQDPETKQQRADLDLDEWDFELEDTYATDDERAEPDSAAFLAGFPA